MRRIAVVALIVLLIIGFVLYETWRGVRETEYASCLASLPDQILKDGDAQEIGNSASEWKILNDAEFERAMDDVKGTDCGQTHDARFDMYGNRIGVAVRTPRDDRWPSIIVWSNGRDGVVGTDDDLVMPYGQSIPKELKGDN